jgi:predicted RecA/RadA family phage recombinase
MKNFVQSGVNVTLPAPYAVTSGQGALVGALFGVASADYANGALGEFVTQGVFDLPKAGSQAWTVGVKVYWDNTNRVCTTTASGNTLIGVATAAVAGGAGDTIGRVRLGWAP